MKRAALITLAIITLATLRLAAQDIVVTVEAPSVVSLGEQFRVTWTVNSRGGDLIPPEFDDFYRLMGPQTSYSQSTQIVNGKVTSTTRNSFTYYLQANRAGIFTLGPAEFIHKNKKYESREIEIEVIDNNNAGAARPGSDQQSAGEDADAGETTSLNNDLYVRLLVNKKTISMGEHAVATLKIYSRVNLSGIQEVNFPDFNGFLKSELETPPLRSLQRENVNGAIYNTGVIQRFLIYPQKTGILTINPSTLTVLVQQRAKSNDPFFGDFFASVNTVPKVIATLPVDINVKALPGTTKKSFYGCVGDISLSSEITSDTLNVNDALTYRIRIKGKGNLSLVSPPQFKLSPDIEIYDPRVDSDLKSTSEGTSGTKVFEYVLIPRHHGLFTIPDIEYTYYNPGKQEYVTLKTKEHSFFVNKNGSEEDETQVFGAVSKDNVTYLGRDIRYIYADNIKLRKNKVSIVSRSSFIIIYLSVLLIFFVVIIWRHEHVKRNSDLGKVKNRKAARVAGKRLKEASLSLKNENSEDFYAILLKAIWGYLADKLGIPASDLSIDATGKLLEESGINEDEIVKLREIIETCEYSRYSPTGNINSDRDIYIKAEKLIKHLENEI